MEKKTIGGFIAVLRKSVGMTQKDLADKLNVSDKAVSRWERDECAPDLSLIPVIADIFGVTADELLRGERRSTGNATAPTGERGDFSAKSKKQIKYIINRTITNYRIQCIIAAVIALLGFIIVAIINITHFENLSLGIGCMIYIIAAVCLTIFTILTLSRFNNDDIAPEEINNCKKTVAYAAWLSASAIFLIFCITSPLFMRYNEPFILTIGTWIILGFCAAVVGMIICALARYVLTNVLMKRGIIVLPEKTRYNRSLSLKICSIFAAVLVLTAVGQIIFNDIAYDKMLFVQGTAFDNYDDFRKYMETPMTDQISSGELSGVLVTDSDSEAGYDIEIICDDKGNELCSYVNRNLNVEHIIYADTDNRLPIKVYSQTDSSENFSMVSNINVVFIIVYVFEAAVLFLIYRRKRVK